MRGFLHAAVLATPAALGLLGGGCGDRSAAPAPIQLAPTLIFPRGLLDGVKTLTVDVYETSDGVDCDPAKGQASGVTPQTPKVASTPPLSAGNCTNGAKFCGTLTIPQSSSARVFSAVATGAAGAVIASGCAKTVVDHDQVDVAIKMLGVSGPATCGNHVVEIGEQCDPAGNASDFVCDAQCHSKEEYLSAPGPMGSTVQGAPQEKILPRFLWPVGTSTQGLFYALWEDRAVHPSSHVAARVLGDSLGLTSALGAGAMGASFFLPNDPSATIPSAPEMDDQGAPSMALLNGKLYVAYQDDHVTNAGSEGYDVHMRTFSATTLAANEPAGMPIGINGLSGSGETGAQFNPGIAAGPNSALYVVWQDNAQSVGLPGRIIGRGYDPGTQQLFVNSPLEISSGSANAHPAIVGAGAYWIVTWESGTDIYMRLVDGTGVFAGEATRVNNSLRSGKQEHPSIAVLPDGRFCIAWTDTAAQGGAQIVMQRFTNAAEPIAGDQAVAVSDLPGSDQIKPVVAGGSPNGGMYVIAWVDSSSGHVFARLASGSSGFLPNPIDGANTSFQASITDGHVRDEPAAAIGGSGQAIAIGWEDLDPSQPGIYARRFPILAR